MERETVKIDAAVAARARQAVEKINQRLTRQTGQHSPTRLTLGAYLSRAIDHYLELGYDPSRGDDQNPLKETIVRTSDRLLAYLQHHEKWYMEPVRQHLQTVEARLDERSAPAAAEQQADLAFIKEMSLYAYLTSDLVLNLLLHQYRDAPGELADLQSWAARRYQERYEELRQKYESIHHDIDKF